MMDAVDKYDPDFIYTDGTSQQRFYGYGTGAGFKADVMQQVIAYYYNQTLKRRGKVNTFSIVKFRQKTNGTVTTEEFGAPEEIKDNEPWIVEIPMGDWYYGADFTYHSGMVIRYIIEAVSRDGNTAICISPLPDGSLDEGSQKMLEEVNFWMRRNCESIYGSRAWKVDGEGEIIDGKLKMLPGGKLGAKHADFKFDTQDFRFTVGKNDAIFAFCMRVLEPGEKIKIKSLGTNQINKGQTLESVRLIGYEGDLQWKQEDDGLSIICPDEIPYETSVVFEVF